MLLMRDFSPSVPRAVLSVNGSSTGWTFSNSNDCKLLSDSSRGAGGNYTVSSAAKHTGVYVCTAERGKPVYNTTMSNTQLIWVTGDSPPVSLIVSPSRTQHFTSASFSLSCEDQSNSTGWRVRRYTERWGLEDCSSVWRSQTGSTCTIRTTSPYDTGVYWCESKSGEYYHPVNITLHFGVILENPVHPVTEGDTLTLRCLDQNTTSLNLRADFYKDGSLIQNQTTEMIISTVSKLHEGFYYCKHPERGESPKSWISVTVSHSGSPISVLHTLSSVLAVCPYLLVTVVMIFKCCRMRGKCLSDLLHYIQLNAKLVIIFTVFLDC
uniref:Ig-like domain-containing protein n=1 Tax=Sinocyclocheilus rhinocerous TaxID=307959 RepID=A0A673KB32_9TELE